MKGKTGVFFFDPLADIDDIIAMKWLSKIAEINTDFKQIWVICKPKAFDKITFNDQIIEIKEHFNITELIENKSYKVSDNIICYNEVYVNEMCIKDMKLDTDKNNDGDFWVICGTIQQDISKKINLFQGKIYIQGGITGFNLSNSHKNNKTPIINKTEKLNMQNIYHDKIDIYNNEIICFNPSFTGDYYFNKVRCDKICENLYSYNNDQYNKLLNKIYDINIGFLLCRVKPELRYSAGLIHTHPTFGGRESNYTTIKNLYEIIKNNNISTRYNLNNQNFDNLHQLYNTTKEKAGTKQKSKKSKDNKKKAEEKSRKSKDNKKKQNKK